MKLYLFYTDTISGEIVNFFRIFYILQIEGIIYIYMYLPSIETS